MNEFVNNGCHGDGGDKFVIVIYKLSEQEYNKYLTSLLFCYQGDDRIGEHKTFSRNPQKLQYDILYVQRKRGARVPY